MENRLSRTKSGQSGIRAESGRQHPARLTITGYLIARAKEYRDATNGAFDIAIPAPVCGCRGASRETASGYRSSPNWTTLLKQVNSDAIQMSGGTGL
ncbi:MAG: hypothetical protein ACLU38_06950 [Dysosmobacter sp.]